LTRKERIKDPGTIQSGARRYLNQNARRRRLYSSHAGYMAPPETLGDMDATGPPPYSLTPVVTDGTGRGATMASVVSMHVFGGRLYVGSAGWYPSL
jgi:hypothetical protein